MGEYWQSMMFAVIVATSYETPIDKASQLLERQLTTHICKGGSYEAYFATADNPEHRAIHTLATSHPG